MTADKAIEYIDIVLEAHPRLRPGDFGQAVKLGQEALKRLQFMRQNLFPLLSHHYQVRTPHETLLKQPFLRLPGQT